MAMRPAWRGSARSSSASGWGRAPCGGVDGNHIGAGIEPAPVHQLQPGRDAHRRCPSRSRLTMPISSAPGWLAASCRRTWASRAAPSMRRALRAAGRVRRWAMRATTSSWSSGPCRRPAGTLTTRPPLQALGQALGRCQASSPSSALGGAHHIDLKAVAVGAVQAARELDDLAALWLRTKRSTSSEGEKGGTSSRSASSSLSTVACTCWVAAADAECPPPAAVRRASRCFKRLGVQLRHPARTCTR